MAELFSFSTKRAGGNIYVQFALPDGTLAYNKSTGCRDRASAERVVMGWVVNNNIPCGINSTEENQKKLSLEKSRFLISLERWKLTVMMFRQSLKF